MKPRKPLPKQSPKRKAAIEAGTWKEKVGKPLKRTNLKVKRKATGERALFVKLYHERGGISEVSGRELLPPDHAMFHHQGSHILNKGMYPELRLDPRNIVMITPDEHDLWHKHGAEGLRYSHGWQRIVELRDALKREADAL